MPSWAQGFCTAGWAPPGRAFFFENGAKAADYTALTRHAVPWRTRLVQRRVLATTANALLPRSAGLAGSREEYENMRLAVLKERRRDETRVAVTPETVRKLVALGLDVTIEHGAGQGASIPDADYTAAGAHIVADPAAALAGAGIVFAVQTPEAAERALIPRGALLVCISGALTDRALVPSLAQAGIDTAAMELLPRITRAQSMDILSSQANLAGYRAVIEGAHAFDRGFAMMMTAAGTVPPARVFVLGAGVAGLQAIATARRLGAIVSATDVRPAAKEEIRSLGATFVGVEDAETAGQTGAYAREMTDEFRRKQAELMLATTAKNDMIICTALVQGGRAPTLVTQAMVDGMKPGSVIVDIAADGGGNCAATRPGEMYVTPNGVKVLGYRNWPGRIPVAASTLYAKNLLTFLTTFWDKDTKAPKLPEDDAIVQGVMLTRGGAVVHKQFAGETSVPPAAPAPEPAGAVVEDASPSLADQAADLSAAKPGLPQASAPAAAPGAPAATSGFLRPTAAAPVPARPENAAPEAAVAPPVAAPAAAEIAFPASGATEAREPDVAPAAPLSAEMLDRTGFDATPAPADAAELGSVQAEMPPEPSLAETVERTEGQSDTGGSSPRPRRRRPTTPPQAGAPDEQEGQRP